MKNLPTGPTIILDDLPPRGWTDTAVPIFPDGCDRLEFYARWLGEHLATTRSTPHRRQKEFLDSLHVPWSEILQNYAEQSLGAQLALAQCALEIVEASHAAGETWEQFQKRQRVAMVEDEEFKTLDFENEYSCCESKWSALGNWLAIFQSDNHQRKNLRTPQWRAGRDVLIAPPSHNMPKDKTTK